MHLAPHVAFATVSTLGAAWLMIKAGLSKSALEHRQRRRVCPSCGRQIDARVCTTCSS
jgi:hypothetical protein